MLAIRALSDIVGLRRNDAWTKYACASAAAFARAYLKTYPVPLRESSIYDSESLGDGRAHVGTPTAVSKVEEAFSNLLPLRYFPTTLYIAPALCKSIKQAWFKMRGRKTDSRKEEHVPGSWTLFERNVYSFTDPEASRMPGI